MTHGPLGAVLASATHKVDDLVTLDLIDNFGLNAGIGHQRRANDGLVTAQHQNIVELDGFARIGGQFFDPQDIA